MTASWIHKLNSDNGRLHKEEVLSQALAAAKLGSINAQIFLGLTKACYSPLVTFGLKQVPVSEDIHEAENPWNDFNLLLMQLHMRGLTGNIARHEVAAMMRRFTTDEWNTFCRPVLLKDLRCGISDKTINKVCKGTEYEIPVFGCQLATSNEDRPEMRGVKQLEPKLDGVRVLMMCAAGDSGTNSVVTSYSRNGKVFENFGHIESQIKNALDTIVGLTGITSFFFDGEIVGNSFQELMRQARRKENVAAEDSVFHIFDIVPTSEFVRGRWNKSLSERLQFLDKISPVLAEMPHVRLVPRIQVDLDTAEGQDQLDRYAHDAVADGYEGIMIKALDAPYQCRRTTSWLKWKPTITVDLEVIDVEEGTGRNQGRLGALVCSGQDGGRTIQVNCGSGYSDSDRDSLWSNRSMVIGRIVEVMADAVTQNQDGTWSLRFPRFIRFRDALTGAKE